MMTLVVTEAVRGGARAGLRVAAAPLITDFPIVALSVFVLAQMAHMAGVLGAVSLAGGCFILLLAWETWKARPPQPMQQSDLSRSLRKGVITNFLSPHPYLFWMTVGSPLLLKGWSREPAAPFLLLAGFYLCLVGAKISVALLVGRSRNFLQGRTYTLVLRFMAAVLLLFALMFFRDGWRLLTAGTL
ncbi:lysine exporter protein LYSE/YGGA [Desulfovibrio ferrophilus]|uniref:Lysine exporter protein LYSE/YGGA n=1 Tax=Desulfovibrio ferrophilus TaxID=241368 RepID=A0A2Z6B1M0_9BACT|nr:lysine exporter protein LYSE/YGGA [Desulfovibrio ferrophilus]